jgi:catalase-peroxidase
MTPLDMALLWDPELMAVAQTFASDAAAFAGAFKEGWTRLMNADRFKGPSGNLCQK